jgi:hypothetical protein
VRSGAKLVLTALGDFPHGRRNRVRTKIGTPEREGAMGDKIMFFVGVWFVASVPIGMAMGRMMRVLRATPEPVRAVGRLVGSASRGQGTRRRAA